MNKSTEKKLLASVKRLRHIALDVSELPDMADHQDPKHDAKRIDREADVIEKLVTGRGTGDN